MSSPGMPADHSLEVEQSQQQAAKEKAAQDKIDAQVAADKLAGLRGTSRSGATGSVNDFFSSQGVDPTQYSGDISSKLNTILSGIDPSDPNPGAAFTDAGSSIFNDLQTGRQNKALRDVNSIFTPNFEMEKVPWTMDDPYLAAIQATQRQSADNVLRNMLDRGVITSTGFGAGQTDLDKQSAGVNARLTSIGTGVLSDEQNSLKGIADKGRQTAQTLKLGQTFDPYSFQGQADQNFSDFIRNLSDTLNSKVGTGNLFSTAGLAGIAGAAQGAGNTAFNPGAAAGIIDPNDPNQKKTTTASTANTAESVF